MKIAELKEVSDSVFPPCTRTDLDALERELKLKLPKSYRAVLFTQNGMLFSPQLYYPVPSFADEDAWSLSLLFGVGDSSSSWSIRRARIGYDFGKRVPPKLIANGCTHGDERVCLSCAGDDTESVYLWQPGLEWEEEDNVRTYRYLTLINPSFKDFLASLYLKEE